MEDCGSDPPGFRLDITQILSEVQHRWLRPAEICEILRNHRKFHLTPEAPFRPVSGSVFLFDRKVLRYFRKDGHNWRKKKDGKTVKEAHEKLKVGSIDVLHCYYAHGEEDDNFQRRSYWMLEQDLMHIVFVHYLEVKGNKVNVSSIRSTKSVHPNYLNDCSLSDSFPTRHKKLTSANADSTSLASTLTEAHEEAESEDSHQACSRFHSYPDRASGMDSYLVENRDTISSSYGSPQSSVEYTPLPGIDGSGKCDLSNFASGPQRTIDLGSWEPLPQHCSNGEMVCQDDFKNNLSVHGNWQFHGQNVNQDLIADSSYDLGLPSDLLTVRGPSYLCSNEKEEQLTQLNLQFLKSLVEVQGDINQENSMDMLELGDYSTIKQPHLSSVKVEEGLKKVDSFSRWVAKELEDVEELHMQPSNQMSWNVIDTEEEGSCLPSQLHVDSDSLHIFDIDMLEQTTNIKLYYLAGNHDIGYAAFHSRMPEVIKRYEKAFGARNYHFTAGKVDFITIDAQTLDGHPQNNVTPATWEFVKNVSNHLSSNPRVLLTHIPLYRPDQTACGSYRSSSIINQRINRAAQDNEILYQNYITEKGTNDLLDSIKPALILSGHDHDQCTVIHKSKYGSVEEHTLGTISWQQGNLFPSYMLLSASNLILPNGSMPEDAISTKVCFLPVQLYIYIWYILLFVITLLIAVFWPTNGVIFPNYLDGFLRNVRDLISSSFWGSGKKLKSEDEIYEYEEIWDAEGSMHLIKKTFKVSSTCSSDSASVERGNAIMRSVARKQETDTSNPADVTLHIGSDTAVKALPRTNKSMTKMVIRRLVRTLSIITIVAAFNIPLYMMLLFKDWIDK